MVRGEHSDLEVVSPSDNPDQQKFPYYSPEPIPAYPHADDTHKESYQAAVHEQHRSQTICGLRKRTFWIVVIVAIVVVAAAVGGGVGGALSSRNSSNSSNNTPQASQSGAQLSSSTTPTPTSAEPTTSVTATQLIGPTATILRDCPSSNNTIYSATFGSSTMQFRKACEISFLNANGIENVIGRPVNSLNDCINLCAAYNINNRTQIASGSSRLCNSVCWRNTFDSINDWPGGMCFAFTTQNITSNGESTWRYRLPAETRCDSAALMNQEY